MLKINPQVGGSIVKQWNFDPLIVAVIAKHEDLARNPGNASVDYVDLVQVANILAHEGTNHPLAKIDMSSVKAFTRVKLETGSEEMRRLEEDTRTVEELLF